MKKLSQYIETVCKSHFSPGTFFLLAISGGVDSMTLLDIMSDLYPEQCHVVTVNHHIRPTSDVDTHKVAMLCNQKGIPCDIQHVHIPELTTNGKGIEETARIARYQILETARQKYHAQAIVTAHHAQDQTETQLMHLIRGCDLPGLIGMPVLNEQNIFRPLLKINKATLQKYAQEHHLNWQEDESNQDTDYFRNHVRKYWLPTISGELLAQISETADTCMQSCQRIIQTWEEQYLDHTASFKRKDWYRLPVMIRMIWLHTILSKRWQLEDVTAAWIGHLYHWIETARGVSNFSHRGKILFSYKAEQITIHSA